MVEGLFIVGDWGTTRLRLALCDAAGIVETKLGAGIGSMTESPEAAFLSLTEAWRTDHGSLPAFLCGMVGSRMGWREVPYASCPADPAILRSAAIQLTAAGCPVSIVPGLTCINPLGGPDVMRGEETQILGAIAAHPQLSQGRHLLALPGTHTKWVALEEGQVRTFLTSPTGEFYALLMAHSTLNKAGGIASPTGFQQGIDRLSQIKGQAGLLQTLFETRSRQMVSGLSNDDAAGFLSGLLIGSDVEGALACFGKQDDVYLIGDPALSGLYQQALRHFGTDCILLDGTDCAFQGLRLIFED